MQLEIFEKNFMFFFHFVFRFRLSTSAQKKTKTKLKLKAENIGNHFFFFWRLQFGGQVYLKVFVQIFTMVIMRYQAISLSVPRDETRYLFCKEFPCFANIVSSDMRRVQCVT